MIAGIAGLIFLWANRVFFTLLFLISFSIYRRRVPDQNQKFALNNMLISAWQIAGTFVLVDIYRASPFHLLWWYPTGWFIVLAGMMLTRALRRPSA
ncbi:MAG: hypothetical protein ABR865_15695 [Terracidiphilus sp.]|jgi:hypothetical protein